MGEELAVMDKRSHLRHNQAAKGAVRQKRARLSKSRLAEECTRLDPREEQALAEEGIAEDLREWPHY